MMSSGDTSGSGGLDCSGVCHLLVIGGQKCGTTWLNHLLDWNDGFWCYPHSQEVHFFDRAWEEGVGHYRASFQDAPCDQVTCDVTPDYMHTEDVPRRMAVTFDQVTRVPRFVALLRDPVDRTVSAFLMAKRRNPGLSLQDALRGDVGGARIRLLYSKALGRYLDLFDRDAVLTLVSEKAWNAPVATLERVGEHCGVSGPFADPYEGGAINQGGRPRSRGLRSVFRFAGRLLRRVGANRLIHRAKRSYLVRSLREWNRVEVGLTPEDEHVLRSELIPQYREDVAELERLLGRSDLRDTWDLELSG